MMKHQTIWDYQPHYRAAVQVVAEQIFTVLDSDLTPHVSLVGIGTQVPQHVVLDPNPDLLHPGALRDMFSFASQMCQIQESPEALHRRISEHGRAHEHQHLGLMRKRLTEEVESSTFGQGTRAFVSSPILLHDYWVFVVVQFQQDAYAIHAHQGHVSDAFDVSTHLVDAAISEFLAGCSKALTEKNPGAKVMVLGREPHEILRSAASTLLYRRTYSLRRWGYPVDLFDVCNAISAMKYEGSAGKGSLLLSRLGDERVEVLVELRERVPLHDHRSARKLLEMATDNLNLLSDAGYIYGLGMIREVDAEPGQSDATGQENFFRINFLDHFEWELMDAGHTVMRVSYGQPALLGKPINARHFRTSLERIFGHLDSANLDHLWEVTVAATAQKKGTILLISDHAASEVERLQNQCLAVQPVHLTPHIVDTVTAIDGALLVDPSGVCHAIGVILDGLAHKNETASRGARYNSAVRYVHTMRSQFGHALLAVVVSTDGMVDAVPQMMPRISRARIDDAIARLDEMNRRREELKFDEFLPIMNMLDASRFYLFEHDALALNVLVDALMPRFYNESRRAAWAPFLGNLELDMSFFDPSL